MIASIKKSSLFLLCLAGTTVDAYDRALFGPSFLCSHDTDPEIDTLAPTVSSQPTVSVAPSPAPSSRPSVSALPTTASVPTIFIADFGQSALMKAELNSSAAVAATPIVTGLSMLFAVAVDTVNERVYYGNTDGIRSCDYDGGDIIDINDRNPYGLAVDIVNGKIYWTEFHAELVKSADLDGSNEQTLYSTSSNVNSPGPSGVAIDAANEKLYITTYNGGDVIQSGLDGSSPTIIARDVGFQGVGIGIGADNLFIAFRDSHLRTSDLDGSNLVNLVSDQRAVQGVATSDSRVYWVAAADDEIRSSDLDGNDVRTEVSSGLSNGWHIAFAE